MEITTVFENLLLRYSQELAEPARKKIEGELWERYGSKIAVLIVDMSGYSRIARECGIVHYLSMIRRLQLTVQPIVENYGGTIVKFEADNADCRFDSSGSAIMAAVALNLALDSANILTPDELDVHVSCGIDYGECLVSDEGHFYGNPVIRASKLGEDYGMPGQILVTNEAMEFVPECLGVEHGVVTLELAGRNVEVHSVMYRRASTSDRVTSDRVTSEPSRDPS